MAETWEEKLVVGAIDFGTTFSGYAFQFRHDFKQNPMKITANNSWLAGGQGLASWKAPTSVLFNAEGNFDSFGYEAEEKYAELAEDDEHEGWYFFHRFKMLLHGKDGFPRDITIEDTMGKPMAARKVFSAAIKFLKNHLEDTLRKRLTDFQDEDIGWVITIPAIWNEPAKQFMREAAIDAGIKSRQLKLALEPEAASIYCKMAPTERLTGGEDLALGTFAPQTKYMVLDIGGGTVDVTVHQVLEDGTLKELHKASGGAWGGTKVDNSYFEVFTKIFGEKCMKDFSRNSRIDHLDLERDFELKKRNVKSSDSRMNIRISVALKEAVEASTGKSAETVIRDSSHRDNVKLTRDRMSFNGKIVQEIFKDAISSIIEHVREVVSLERAKGLKLILMVGGFSESPILLSALREAFPDFTIMSPEDPGLAVVKGAVLFGHLPNAISSRICKYTIGVASCNDFDPKIHPEELKFTSPAYAVPQCRNLFSKFVSAGQDIQFDQAVEKIYDISDPSAPVVVEVFTSTETHPIFTTDRSCTRLGQIHIEVPKGGWDPNTQLRVEFGFGGTEFTVKAIDTHTNSQYDANFDLLE